MLTLTPFSNKPSDLPIFEADAITEYSKIPTFDSRKPAGDRRVAGSSSLEDFFSGVNALVGSGAISGPASQSAEAVTATVGGAAIASTASFVTVTSSDANHIVILPAPVVRKTLWIHNGATGYELRSSDPATIAINGGSGASAESAIAANSTCFLICVSATAWKGFFMDSDGDLAKIEAAA